ncbi:MAG TPA: carboxypeptidase regulatory-like domain-containing protein [Terriglobales bacterium]
MRRVLPAFLLFTAALAFAQDASDASPTSRISGTVIDSVTQQPLAGSEVTLRGPTASSGSNWKSLSVTADAEGHFTFDGLAVGRYIISAFQTGYVNMGPGRAGSRMRTANLTAPGQTLDDFTVALTPGGVISGHVTNSAGKPLNQVTVQVLRHEYISGHIDLGEVSSAQTGKSGEYHITSLSPGHYFLRFLYLDPQPQKPGSDEAYIATYYPGTTDQSQAIALTIRAGEELGAMDATLTPRHTMTVKGTVVDAVTKTLCSDSEINLIPKEGAIFPSPYHASADAKGRFEIHGVPAGEYIATAEVEGEASHATKKFGQKPVRISEANVDNLELLVARGVEVSGRIRIDGKTIVDLTQITGSIDSTETWAREYGGEIEDAHVRSDGSFIFYDVPEGSYRISFSAVPPGTYIKSSTSGGAVEDTSISVPRAQSVTALDFSLNPNAASITGAALSDEQPAPGVVVLVVPSADRRSIYHFYKRVVTDSQGKFSIAGLIPGDYKLFAFDDMRRGAMMDPDFLAEFETAGKDVTLKEGDSATIQIDVIPSD